MTESAASVHTITERPVHLGLGAVAQVMPPFDGSPDWYQQYAQDTAADGVDGRLVSMHTFTESWDTWEVHPHGHELVLCVSGTITLHQEAPDGTTGSVTISAGEYVINDPGVWHTADVSEPVTAVFVTAGQGTEMRDR